MKVFAKIHFMTVRKNYKKRDSLSPASLSFQRSSIDFGSHQILNKPTWHLITRFGNDRNNRVSLQPMHGRESETLSNLKQFGVDLMMLLLLLLLVLLLYCRLLHRNMPRGLTNRLLLAAVVLVQNAVEMRRHVLISDHLVLKGVPHQQIAGFLVTGFIAVRQRVLFRKNVHGAAVDAQSWSFEDSSLGRFRRQRR